MAKTTTKTVKPAAAKASAMPKPAAKKAAPAKRASVTTRKAPSKATRREAGRTVLAMKRDARNNSGRVLELALRPNGATGYELTAINGYEFPARRVGLERIAARFGYTVKVLQDASKDGSPRYKFV